jgi:hypothetical protein
VSITAIDEEHFITGMGVVKLLAIIAGTIFIIMYVYTGLQGNRTPPAEGSCTSLAQPLFPV